MRRLGYRKAKKFKLDEDFDVVDVFSGHKKKVVKADWNDYHGDRRPWELYANPIYRLIQKSEGKSFNEVRSYFKRKLRGRSAHQQYRLSYIFERNAPEETIVRDGILQYKAQRWGRGHINKPGNGELYINSEGVVTRSEEKKRNHRNRWHYERKRKFETSSYIKTTDKICPVDKDNIFKQVIHTYNFRVAPGVLKEIQEFNWFKWYAVEVLSPESYWDYADRCQKTRMVLKNKLTRTSASKKDIRDFKLNEI